MKDWITSYVKCQNAALSSVSSASIERIVDRLKEAMIEKKQIFAFGNGGSGANASHFATDLGKGASDTLGSRFKVTSLNDNFVWISAIANDYKYEDIFWRQLENQGTKGDIVFAMSVSGNSPNVLHALKWAKENNLFTIALVGANGGQVAAFADELIVVDSKHYGRVEDVHMNICHILCYAFMERIKETT